MESGLRSELENIKKQLVALAERQEYLEDALLSTEDEKAIKFGREDFKKGRTISLEEVKKRHKL